MAGPERDRIAEIIVRTDDGRPDGRGSGYRVTDGAVLTAAHVVAGTGHIWVRFNADLPGESSVPAQVLVADPAADVAVLSVAPRVLGENLAPALFGALRSEESRVGKEC